MGSHLSGECPIQRGQPQFCKCGVDHTANYLCFINLKEARAAPARKAPERGRKNTASGHPAEQVAKRTVPTAEQMDLAKEWNDIRGGACLPGNYSVPKCQTCFSADHGGAQAAKSDRHKAPLNRLL